MSTHLRALSAILVILLTSSIWAAQPVTATLELLPESALPGLPVAFLIKAINPADVPQSLANGLRLEVASQTGTFIAHGSDPRNTVVSISSAAMSSCAERSCLTIPAHGKREFYINYDSSLTGNEFFGDARLDQPGTYGLTAILVGGELANEIRTNTATLTVRQPTGVDAEVRDYLSKNASAHGVWTSLDWGLSEKVAKEIRSRFAGSSYLQWIVSVGQDDPVHAPDLIEAALATNPTPSLRDNLLADLGSCLEALAQRALLNERDADKSANLDARARTTFKKLGDVAVTDALRTIANQELRKLDSRTPQTYRQSLAFVADSDPPAPEKIVPLVKCISRLNGNSFAAHFGYSNPNRVAKYIPVGVLNKVTPAPQDQLQPRRFLLGSHEDVFVATSPGGDLIWHLDSNTATATLSSTPCAVSRN